MIIDLARVRFVTPRALSLLPSFKKLVESHHGELLICNLREQLLRVFRISGQDRFLSLYPTRDHALGALGLTTAG